MISRKKVLISGAGVAGIVCAVLLDKEKYDVEIIERSETFRNIGFSLTVWKSGFSQLRSLFESYGEKLINKTDYLALEKFILFGGPRLNTLKELNIAGYAWDFNRNGLMQRLEHLLSKALPSENIIFSRWIHALNFKDNAAGTTEVVFNNNQTKQYDIIILAEGINSTSRKIVFPEKTILPLRRILTYAWFNEQTMLENAEALFFTSGYVGVVHPNFNQSLLGFYSSTPAAENAHAEFLNTIVHTIKQKSGQNTSLDFVTSKSFALKKIHLPQYYYKNVVIIGDSAHGHPPTIGFGTTLAIEDAVLVCKIANELEPENFKSHVVTALAKFSAKRVPRVRDVYRFQNLIEYFISNNPLAITILSLLVRLTGIGHISRKIKNLASYDINS